MNYKLVTVFTALLLIAACSTEKMPGGGGLPAALKDVPSVRLNFRYEPDVPAPETTEKTGAEERNAAVQADFDQNRVEELIDMTIVSPNGKRVAVVYHRPTDAEYQYRLDMYSAEGSFLKKITSDLMAVHFPETIRWSPDSTSLAFLAKLRGASAEEPAAPNGVELVPTTSPAPSPVANSNSNATVDPSQQAAENSDANANVAVPAAPTPEAPTGILTFRTEQLYICDSEGSGTKPLTQNEGFIYFYYVWSPDSSMLAALAAHAREWYQLKRQAEASASVMIPVGRPRVIEKTGRERRLDDALTDVQPVWSPDSAKVAAAFQHQVRIYDALGTNPTQAAIPLRNQLLISSQAYDQAQASKLNADANQAPANSNTAAPSTLPDANTLVSFNPIILLSWNAPDLLYFETAFVKRMKNEADSATSFARWHRLILTPQAQPAAN